MKDEKNVTKFWPFRKLADHDYRIKGFEIRFQKMIEEYLEGNGISAPWWKYCSKDLFMEIWKIYEQNSTQSNKNLELDVPAILRGLHGLYSDVKKEVIRKVKETKQKECDLSVS
ncbi:hypothetical protein [Faecalicoccus acidiformans]|uniref:Uncharacterized protein n=1 Tax=Faecalicoccus acidiformans TaxID=915173 RepID=A0ABS2FLX1_9FIRM|nr:hypothetical protein [Faecalicoccus acidiformans]MBM6830998.1 hypothetical protein [Faecalicoccus acidiformans]